MLPKHVDGELKYLFIDKSRAYNLLQVVLMRCTVTKIVYLVNYTCTDTYNVILSLFDMKHKSIYNV